MPNTTHRGPLANIEGKLMPLAEVKVSVLDRGFLFGDAVYEVLRVYAGRPWLEVEHFDRLAHSLDAVRIGGVDVQRLRRRMHETIAAGSFREATVYIQVTRGAAPRAHAFPTEGTPFELLYVQEFTDSYRDARQTGAAVITHPDLRWQRCDIKSTNLLGNVLAMQAAKEAGCLEALLYLPNGGLTEGTHTSFFAVRDGMLLTAPNGPSILPGITRAFLLRLAGREDIRVRERAVQRAEFGQVAELLLAGTTAEVLPVVCVDDKPVGDGRPGPITRRLQKAYEQAVRAFLSTNV